MTLERYLDEVMSSEDKNNLSNNIGKKTSQKISFQTYIKKFNQQLRQNNRAHLIPYMKDKHYQALYNKSKYSKTKIRQTNGSKIIEKIFKIKKIKVKRKGKTYQRTIQPRWPTNSIALKQASTLKPRSKEYNDYVNSIVESTGRSRQAVIKKIQRIRKSERK